MFNFMNIEPSEFEDICHEILEKIINQSCRVFGKGPDGGIDIQSNENEKIIGQAKLYINSTTSVTVDNVKKEFNRIKKQKIDQYYLFIGRELSKDNIEDIYNEFKMYMKSKENIYTLKEIDEILQKEEFNHIVKKHIKLWMCSTNVLELVLNRDIFFDCDILFDDIQKELELFVQTDMYDLCKKILEEKRNLLILGSPGIGKTTTSKMLTLYFAQMGYVIRYTDARNLNELKNSISLDYDKKEFIFLDDCLGQSYLELHEEKENDLIRFIKYVKNNPNKILLLNSRITVFQEAITRKFDLVKTIKNKDFYMQEINIGNLSNLEKAKILYSHLQVKNVPDEYKNEIIKSGNYMKIIKSASYNPRIIDYMTDKNRYLNIAPNKYVDEILKAFEKSEYVWEDEFKYRIDIQDRIFLYTLYSISPHAVKENILKQAFLKRLKLENIDTTVSVYEDVLKRLNESFVKIVIENGKRFISVINPSVNDFLRNKLSENKIEKERLQKSIIAIEQCNRIMRNNIEKEEFIREKLQSGAFSQLLTNQYNSVNDVCLAYIVKCDMINNVDIPNIVEFIKNLQNSYVVFDEYITKTNIIISFYMCLKYKNDIEKLFSDGMNITYLLRNMPIDEQIKLLQCIFDNGDVERINNKDVVVKFMEESFKDEIRFFSDDELEMDIALDEIVASEIENLKMDYENDEISLQLYDNNFFKEELLERTEKSFNWACANYISESINNLYSELPDFIFYNIEWIDVESYINDYMIKELAKKYINLVFDTPEQDYRYYKKYIYDGHLLSNSKNEENIKIHNIFKIK